MSLLKLEGVKSEVEGKEILKGLNLTIRKYNFRRRKYKRS